MSSAEILTPLFNLVVSNVPFSSLNILSLVT